MHAAYQLLLEEQEKLEASRLHALTTTSFNYDKNVAPTFDRHSGPSIYERFKRAISPRVMKFIAIEEVTRRESGWNDNDYYHACNEIFQKRNPRMGNFDEFKACKEDLADKPKWKLFRAAEMESEKKPPRPAGGKKDKKANDEKQMIRSVLAEVKNETESGNDNQMNGGGKNGAGNSKATFFDKAGTVMKQQHEMKMVELMSTPQKREWREAQFNLMMAETRAKRAALDKVEEDTTVAEVAFPTDQGDA